MQFDVPGLHGVGTGVCNVLVIVFPEDCVAPFLHVADELLFGAAALHAIINDPGELHLPALPLFRGTVLSGAHAIAALG